ncbi:MAG: phytoene/squalene synthase family protein [Treponemataceae bacterium]|nr:phytoene/squalene synthase family protein [Treponemataceae bacterium]
MEEKGVSSETLRAYQRSTFQRGSTTYFNASIFFPKKVRERVFTLYAFVRRADDFVDAVPQDEEGFYQFRSYTEGALGLVPHHRGEEMPILEDRAVIDAFVKLGKTVGFDPLWTVAFLDAMEADLTKKHYDTLEECLAYMYGSAEVIGLFMCRCLDVSLAAFEAARLLGRSMQYINFIRDIAEDRVLGRRYLPLEGFSSEVVDPLWAHAHPDHFSAWLTIHLNRYREWQRKAVEGYSYIPYRYRLPIKTAADMYWWTAKEIEKHPLVVFERKVKPRKARIILQFFINMLRG